MGLQEEVALRRGRNAAQWAQSDLGGG